MTHYFDTFLFCSQLYIFFIFFIVQGYTDDLYSSQAGVALLGKSYELVNKRDWKGQLQTALLRRYKGCVSTQYSFMQAMKTDKFIASVLLTHSDPLIGSCCINGSHEHTKKASEKTAAERACNLLEMNILPFIPQSASTIKSQVRDDDYSTGNESAQALGSALKGLFGNNYTPSPIAPSALPSALPLSSIDLLTPTSTSSSTRGLMMNNDIISGELSNINDYNSIKGTDYAGMKGRGDIDYFNDVTGFRSNFDKFAPVETGRDSSLLSKMNSSSGEDLLDFSMYGDVKTTRRSETGNDIYRLNSDDNERMNSSSLIDNFQSTPYRLPPTTLIAPKITSMLPPGLSVAPQLSMPLQPQLSMQRTDRSRLSVYDDDWQSVKSNSTTPSVLSLESSFLNYPPAPPSSSRPYPGANPIVYPSANPIAYPGVSPSTYPGVSPSTYPGADSRDRRLPQNIPISSVNQRNSSVQGVRSNDAMYGPSFIQTARGDIHSLQRSYGLNDERSHVESEERSYGRNQERSYGQNAESSYRPNEEPSYGLPEERSSRRNEERSYQECSYGQKENRLPLPNYTPSRYGQVRSTAEVQRDTRPLPFSMQNHNKIIEDKRKMVLETDASSVLTRDSTDTPTEEKIARYNKKYGNYDDSHPYSNSQLDPFASPYAHRRSSDRYDDYPLSSMSGPGSGSRSGISLLSENYGSTMGMRPGPGSGPGSGIGSGYDSNSYGGNYRRSSGGPGMGPGFGPRSGMGMGSGTVPWMDVASVGSISNSISNLNSNSSQRSFHPNYQDNIDYNSDSKSKIFSIDDELDSSLCEKKATDWKGELQTFLARNCKDFPFKIEYNSDERTVRGQFVARVTITFDNKGEEKRVIHGIPADNKKKTERIAAGMYGQLRLS